MQLAAPPDGPQVLPDTGQDRPAGRRPLLLAVDGDGLLHRSFHGMGHGVGGPAQDQDRDSLGRPTWALRGMIGFVAAAAGRLRPDGLLVGLDSRVDPVRRARFAGYKAHRAPHPPELADQLAAAGDLLAEAGVPHLRPGGHEADDVLASAAAWARREGWDCVLLTSDRDSFALLDDTTSVLRLMNGGIEDAPIMTPARLSRGYGVTPAQYRDFAALRGDPSDNLPGVRGIGSRTAARLLAAYGCVQDAVAAIDAGRLDEVAAVIGPAGAAELAGPDARAAVARNRDLMAMVDDLPLPGADALRLPLDRERLRTALRARAIGLNSCLWALVGDPPPPWEPNGYHSAPRGLPAVPAAGRPPWALPPLPSAAELAATRARRTAASAAGTRQPGQPAGHQQPRRFVARRTAAPGRLVPAGQLSLF